MTTHSRFLSLVAVAVFVNLVVGCAQHPPATPREFRAAWVATVANIDWPSKPGLTSEQQQKEALAILDKSVELKLNAIILQVRTSCDALYPSELEPWSYYLTGEQGKPPTTPYDPLRFWVDEAHRRGIELHAWFNPFRAKQTGAKYELSKGHVANTHPELVRSYGSVMWMDPGEEGAQQATLAVMADVVQRYDVDGIHIDDYFYPYREKEDGKVVDFPDDATWGKYQQSGGKLSRDDWRRDNINRLVKRMYEQTKRLKPWVKVGISPFGIWRPGNPPVVQGFDAYSEIYADSKLWLNQGWVDYFTPQLYWKLEAPKQPYKALLEWWAGQNTQGRNLWPGLYTSRIKESGAKESWEAKDITGQIDATRETAGASGHVHFSMICLMQDRRGIDGALKREYAPDALVPASPWLSKSRPPEPRFAVKKDGEGLAVSWGSESMDRGWLWTVAVRYEKGWRTMVLPGDRREVKVGADAQLGVAKGAAVGAVDRYGNVSKAAGIKTAR